jgi:hypothetical protein
MSLISSDLKVRLSIKTGSAGNSLAQSDPNQSLGKYISTTDYAGGVANDLFAAMTGDQNASLTALHRGLFLYNSHGSLAALNLVAWIGGPRFTALASNDTFTSNSHGFSDGDIVRVSAELNTDTLPTGVDNSTTYYVRDSATNTFKLAATLGGSAINLTVDGSGCVRMYAGADEAIGLDTTAQSALANSSAQGLSIVDETTAPVGVSFSTPLTKATGISVTTSLTAGNVIAVWFRRTGTNSAAQANDRVTLKLGFDSL